MNAARSSLATRATGAAAEGAADPAAAAAAGELPDVAALTVAQLQEALAARGLDTKWSPLKGKKELVDRLQVSPTFRTLSLR